MKRHCWCTAGRKRSCWAAGAEHQFCLATESWSRGCSTAELPGAVRGSGGRAGRAGRRSRTHTRVVGRLTLSEWGLSSAALLQMPRSRDSRQPHYPQTSLPPSSDPDLRAGSDPPPDDGLSQQRQETNTTSPHWHRDSDTTRLPQQGPGFTRQTRPCDPKGQQCRLVRRPRPTGLSPGPSLHRLEFAPALHCPGARPPRQAREPLCGSSRSAPRAHTCSEKEAGSLSQCALCCGSTMGPGWAFPDLTLQREGHPRPTQLYVAASIGCGV